MNRSENVIIVLLMSLCLSVFSGCQTGAKHYESAMQLNKAGNYKNAIAYLEEALRLDADNEVYRNALKKIKQDQISKHLSIAKEYLDVSPMTFNALTAAKNAVIKAEEIDAGDHDVKRMKNRYDALASTFYQELKTKYQAIQNSIASQQWDVAYFDLQQLQSRFSGYEDSIQLMKKVKDQGAEFYYSKAQKLLDKDNISEAISVADKSLAINMNYTPSRELLKIARDRDNFRYFVQKATTYASREQWVRAIDYYERAKTYEPENQELDVLMSKVYGLASAHYIQLANNQVDSEYLLRAVESYNNAMKYASAIDSSDISALRERLKKSIANAAGVLKTKGHFGSAWFWYNELKKINENYPNIFILMQSMEDEINTRIKKAIAVFDFGSPSDYADAGVIVANNLISYLFKSASKDIKILERENLKSILEEMKLGQIGVINPDSTQQMGKVYGINVAIMGSVLLYKVESYLTKGQKTIRYKTGKKIVDNIKYLNWKAKHPNPGKKELEEAPSAKIIEDVFSQKDYEVSQQKKIGFVQLAFRIVDVATGENIKVDTIEVKKEIVDEGSAGLPEANIRYDPLEIVTNVDLLQELTDKAVAELGRVALEPMQYMEKSYFDAGEAFLKRRNTIAAAENYINSIFDEKMKMISNSPISAASNKKVYEIFYNYQALQGESHASF